MPSIQETEEYDPLDYANLARSCVVQLLSQPIHPLPLQRRFRGAGVYALFYTGGFPPYTPVRSDPSNPIQPIYVGKAEPTGARKGAASGSATRGTELYSRLRQHVRSIAAVENLRVEDFLCRYLVVVPLWIRMVERFLIEDRRPPWNGVLDGFGLHDPGRGRSPEVSWWDAMHPDRPARLNWKANIQRTRTVEDAARELEAWLTSPTRPVIVHEDE